MGRTHKKTAKQRRDAVEVVNVDDYVSALRELEQNSNAFKHCYSSAEIADRLGGDLRHARNIIKDGIEDGTCEYAGKRPERGIDGRLVKTPVYRFKLKNK